MHLAGLKKYFLFVLIGSLIVSALVAVVTILVGEFGEVAVKVLLTLGMVIGHSLVSLAFIWNDERRGTFERLGFFTNVLFFLIVLSFITSLFGIWEVISGELLANLYQTYFVLGFAALHGDVLSKTLRLRKYIDALVYANYIFMGIVVLILQPVIYLANPMRELGEMYFRVLGAAGVVDGTLSFLVIIFYRLYMHKHPELQNVLLGPAQNVQPSQERKGLSWWVWLLIVYLAFQVILPLIFFLFNSVVLPWS